MSDGKVYEVRHPEQALPDFTSVSLLAPTSPLSGPQAEGFINLSLLHVVRLEPLPASPSGNGEG